MGIEWNISKRIFNGRRCAARTRDLWFRRPALYPTELIALTLKIISDEAVLYTLNRKLTIFISHNIYIVIKY